MQYYIQRIVRNSTELEAYKKDTVEANALQIEEQVNLAKVHARVEAIRIAPEEARVELLDQLFTEAQTIKNGLEIVNRNVIVGFTELIKNNTSLQEKVDFMKAELAKVNEEVAVVKAERLAREARKAKLAQKKEREPREPIKEEQYNNLLATIGFEMTFEAARMRITLALLFITGFRIGEVRKLLLRDIKSIFDSQRPCVALTTLKGKKYRTAHLSALGKRKIKPRKEDFRFILKHQKGDLDTHMFGNKKDHSRVTREYITKEINKMLKPLRTIYNGYYTSHSFRSGFIQYLWEETGDIELVRQELCHAKSDTTKDYIKDLSDRELSARISRVGLEEEEDEID